MPWLLASFLATTRLEAAPTTVRPRPLRTLAPPVPPARGPDPKPRSITYDPWELVPS